MTVLDQFLLWLCVPFILPFEVFGHEALLLYALLATWLWCWQRRTGWEEE